MGFKSLHLHHLHLLMEAKLHRHKRLLNFSYSEAILPQYLKADK